METGLSGDGVQTRPGQGKAKRHRWRGRLITLVVLIILGLLAYHLLASGNKSRTGKHAGGTPPQSVQVATISTGSMPETITALGTVTPDATVTVVPQLSGYLTAVGFTQGEDVTKGQFLAQIDPRPYEVQLQQYQAALAKDQAALGQARSDLARYTKLSRQNSIAEQQVTDQTFLVAQDEAAIKADEANIASANLDIAYCHITAPVSGRVGLRLIDPGNYVTASSATGIVVITTIKPTTVIFTIPQNDLGRVVARVHAGAKLPVTAYSSDNTTKIATGTLQAIDNQMSTTTGTVQLRAVFTNDNEALFPNEFVNVSMLVDTLTKAVLVPNPAIQNGAPGDYVYVVKTNHTAAMTPVTLGPTDGTNTVVTKGLTTGEQVVTDGVDRLTDGAKVMVVSGPVTATPAASGSKKTQGAQGQ